MAEIPGWSAGLVTKEFGPSSGGNCTESINNGYCTPLCLLPITFWALTRLHLPLPFFLLFFVFFFLLVAVVTLVIVAVVMLLSCDETSSFGNDLLDPILLIILLINFPCTSRSGAQQRFAPFPNFQGIRRPSSRSCRRCVTSLLCW